MKLRGAVRVATAVISSMAMSLMMDAVARADEGAAANPDAVPSTATAPAPIEAPPPGPPGVYPEPPVFAAPPVPALPDAPLAPPPPALEPLRRAGLFHRGINIDLLELGAVEAFGAGGSAAGVLLGHGAEIDLGPRLAWRLPLRIPIAAGSTTINGDSGAGAFVAAMLAPGIVYRFRDSDRQHWIPFLTAAIDLGVYSFGRHLLGLAPAPENHAQDFARSGPAPSVGAGFLFSPVRLFALRFAADYTYLYVAHTSLHVVSETLAIRFSL